MARRIPLALVGLLIAVLGSRAFAQNRSSVLVQYSFDDNLLDTGPDTFSVFQRAKGSVRLNSQNRFSGYHSIEIRDVAGDKDFPELQGYFQLRSRGKVFAHFAMMTTNPAEELNIALAGPGWFVLRKDGIGFWLKTIDGYLCAYSDSIPKKLFAIRPFVWYVVNVAYDIDAGAYDLLIYEEGRQDPVISLQRQPNAAKQPGSAVSVFSFIGDNGADESNVVYYVDDVIVGVDESITQLPFQAPGRRKLFVDYWNEYQRGRRGQPSPLPLIDFADLGIRPADIASLKAAGLWDLLQQVVTSSKPLAIPANASPDNRRLLQAVSAWRAGCDAFNNNELKSAVDRYTEASRLLPSGKIYAMDLVLALAALGDWRQVDAGLRFIYSAWRDDIRFPVAAAMIGMARGDLEQAESLLRNPAEASTQPPELIADQYFYVLLWQQKARQAQQFAQRMIDRSQTPAAQKAIWIERLGDAAFISNDFGSALRHYEASLAGANPPEGRILLKLSDVYFRLGDLDKERHYRELIYGRLER